MFQDRRPSNTPCISGLLTAQTAGRGKFLSSPVEMVGQRDVCLDLFLRETGGVHPGCDKQSKFFAGTIRQM